MSKKDQKSIRFAEGTRLDDTVSSQNSSVYKEALSQPAPNMSHKEKLLWLQKRRHLGLWVQCDDCGLWRHLPHVLDSKELPEKWYCKMNPDKSKSTCKLNETPLKPHDEEDLIHSEYSAGSVVWARLDGWPWWPAMVDDCVDTEQFYWLDGFSDIPTHYNVVFFDSTEVTRSWISPENLKPYNEATKSLLQHLLQKKKKNKRRIEAAMAQADDAITLPLSERLEKYSFIAQFRGPIKSPKKASRENLLRIQKKLQNKYNVPFPIESSSDSEEGYYSPSDDADTAKTNTTIGETPKTRSKATRKKMTSPEQNEVDANFVADTQRSSFTLGNVAETPKTRTKATPKKATTSKENEADTNFTVDTQKSSFTVGKPTNRKKKFVINSESQDQDYQETPKKPRFVEETRIEDSLIDVNSQSTLVVTQNADEVKQDDSLAAQQGSTNPPNEDETLINESQSASEMPSSEFYEMENITTRIQRMQSPTGSEDFEFE